MLKLFQNLLLINLLKRVYLVILDQGPPKRFIRNLFKGHLIGIISKRSHLTASGKEKIAYNTKKSAQKAAAFMYKKYGNYFSNYRCLHCGKFHIGKNSENKGS